MMWLSSMAAREDRNMAVEGSSMRENRFMQHAIATLRTSGLMRVVLMCMVVLSPGCKNLRVKPATGLKSL